MHNHHAVHECRKNREAPQSDSSYDGNIFMANSATQASHPEKKIVGTASIVLAFASVYFFWGSTYTAIRIGAAEMPALLLAGTRFLIAGAILLAWCRWRGLRIFWPAPNMLRLGLIGLLLLGGGNVGLVYAEKTVPSGLASLVLAVIPLYVALIEMFLPGGEPEIATISPKLMTLYISGYTDREVTEYDPANSRTGFLQKPFALQTLLKKLRAMIATRG